MTPRQTALIALLEAEGSQPISRLAARLAVSDETARRDVAQLAALPQVEADEAPAYVAALQEVVPRFERVSQVVLHVTLRGGLPHHAARGLLVVMVICALASTLAIRVALRVDPATAIGG